MDFKKSLTDFVETRLAKMATRVRDFAGVLRGIDPEGKKVVNHRFHMTRHPPEHQRNVDLYNHMLESPKVVKRTPHGLEGITRKAVYSLPHEGSPEKRTDFMVKPYHERIGNNVKFWMQHPIQGWSEMTNQALFHAAGLGSVHQPVHVSEHNMGEGNPSEPAIVVHMHPNAKYVENMEQEEWSPQIHDDATKIAFMDFLTNNMDRHPHNLMLKPLVNEHGDPETNRLLAIDHGRNFQYKASAKNNSKWAFDPRLGIRIRIPDHMLQDTKVDNIRNYLDRWGMQAVGRHAIPNGRSPIDSIDSIKALRRWWPGVRDEVIREFETHLGAIRNKKIRDHLSDNFHARVDVLNNLVRKDPRLITDKDIQVPILPFQS